MERMDMHSSNEYLKVVKERYFMARTRKEKSQILNEYCGNTGQSRKYVITKIHKAASMPRQRKKRKELYDGQVKAALAKIEVLHFSRSKKGPKPGYILRQRIPIKLTEWDTSIVGYLEADLV